MNELIKSLREQAYTIVSKECKARGELYEAREYNEWCDQVFAEMIIAECAAIAWFAEQYDMGDDKPISKQITEHFGVKYERQD